ncbi:hypothetical protein [Persicirhabdus sediminis]|uniref:Uncharacterized protein n=1 Tax=Persicirhabdus sediminis TaxID=454144 RepID=A0A8J7SNN5_9BACT|nr:hypothetical protein [Persicirhabdus sediminis]MBK1792790.1 hypothetical protein [Persicirhabdus sediminis]
MDPITTDRKVNTALPQAEDETLNRLKKMHPEWVAENGECPECVVREHEMADHSQVIADAHKVSE